mmetsp:Transcript_162874/g.312837  ORF Transcript_162874/g.312837 Transcript_162874/m.312837 type:complete len:80 (+) Transcript_162874:1342-1581(+)
MSRPKFRSELVEDLNNRLIRSASYTRVMLKKHDKVIAPTRGRAAALPKMLGNSRSVPGRTKSFEENVLNPIAAKEPGKQ